MSNYTPAVIPNHMQSMVSMLPAEYAAAMAANFADTYQDLGGAFRSISFAQFQFTFKNGGSSEPHPDNYLDVIILGTAKDRHHVWYKEAYKNGQDMSGKKPDAVWWAKDNAPSNVPPSALVKNADGYNQYQINQRIAVIVARYNLTTGEKYWDFENPYAIDVSSMSLFGNDIPEQGAFSLGSLIRFGKDHKILLCQFMTRIIFDRTASVPSVRFVPHAANGQLQFLDPAMLAQVCAVGTSTAALDLLNVNVSPANGPQQALQAAPAAAYATDPYTNMAPTQPTTQQAPMPEHVSPATPAYQPPVQQAAPVQQTPVQQMQQMAQPGIQATMAMQQQPPMQQAAPMQMPGGSEDLMQQAAQASARAAAMVQQQPPAQQAPAQQLPSMAPSQTTPMPGGMTGGLNDLLNRAGAYNGQPQA